MVKKLLDLPLSSRIKIIILYVQKKKRRKVKQCAVLPGQGRLGFFLMYQFSNTRLVFALNSKEGFFIRKLWLFAVGL